MTTLTIFDLDDTLFKSDAKIMVMFEGRCVKELKPDQYNTYKPKPGETLDFSQFRSASIFNDTAYPVRKMLTKAKRIIHNKNRSPRSKCIILTARADMDDRDQFLATLRNHGIDVDRLHVERSGNLSFGTVEHKKRQVIELYLRMHNFTCVRMFDDSTKNLHELMSMAHNFPHVKFEAYHVLHDGTVVNYGTGTNSAY